MGSLMFLSAKNPTDKRGEVALLFLIFYGHFIALNILKHRFGIKVM